jgi:hypothetical protein
VAEAWIYTDESVDDVASDVARLLAELGFAPRKVNANGSLRPEGDGGGGGAAPRPPRTSATSRSSWRSTAPSSTRGAPSTKATS